MSYCKVIPAVARAKPARLFGARLRSTAAAASTQPKELKTEDAALDRSCTVVEKPCDVDLFSGKAHAERQRISVNFDNTREAYKSKDTLELLRSLLVFKLCTFDFLVDKNKELMDLSKKVLGQRLFEKLMKMTFYGQFVAGEDQNAIKPLIEKNQAFGVGSVLDYSVEEDLTQEEAEKKEMDSCVSEAEKESHVDTSACLLQENECMDHREKKYKAHRQFGDRRGGVISARTYFYADEAKCDHHMETFINCIKASAGSSVDGFSAIKMTALGRPQFLLQFSEVLVKWRRFFSLLAAHQGKDGMAILEQKLELEQLQDSLIKLGVGAKSDIENWFTGEKLGSSGTIDLLDWNSLINDTTKISNLLVVPNIESGHLEPLLSKFTDEEEKQMKRMLQRMDVLAKHAVENGVRLMVDAEQTYFQPAISRLTLEMQRIFNREKPNIFNTYQCYLREAYDNVSVDVELSRREGWYFGAKLVRGAYMYQERSRAAEIGYEDPINPDYEATNRMYHKCLEYILEEINHNRMANVMVASHNEDTVKFTLDKMNEMSLFPTENKVYFGQLLGMCDQISFPLGQAGFPVYKYVPYGPVNEVIPYLSRRAQENRGFMKGSQRERSLLWKELKRRFFSRQLLYRPVY
ncbi:proline dehydrogenase 1, mitochondrial isoform X1 [Puntigrus tetrazona]|uniref:proline dehydrogenase 1, mitochondrial isoform X1 n=1 Tax=Puntigrus tetrazona TaxID=1606681 RepID=UPI001C88F5C5|nr:proline dehydrogenase 1, mitochondrial isoform X1 [Puntigrus tetrazona]